MEELKVRWESLDKLQDRKLSEIDTQVLLIEPVLKIAGWDLLDYSRIRRDSRNVHGEEFDIELYSSDNFQLMFAIECKALTSGWFNINKISQGIGKLEMEGEEWGHAANRCDGVGQLRGYCMNYKHFNKKHSTAILTNGYEWVIFDNRAFVPESELPTEPISQEAVKAQAKLDDNDFDEKIIKFLKPCNSGRCLIKIQQLIEALYRKQQVVFSYYTDCIIHVR